MLRLPGMSNSQLVLTDMGLLIVRHVAPMLDLTFLMMTNEMIINDLMPLLLTLAISLWTFGNGMYHIMYE